jgi:hypothetical protein
MLRGLGNGECVFRDLDDRAGRIGVDLVSEEPRDWIDTNPTRARRQPPSAATTPCLDRRLRAGTRVEYEMSIALAVASIFAASVSTLAALAGLLRWVYRRGEASGADKARRDADERSRAEDKTKIQDLERALTQTRAELASTRVEFAATQPRRKRALRQ